MRVIAMMVSLYAALNIVDAYGALPGLLALMGCLTVSLLLIPDTKHD